MRAPQITLCALAAIAAWDTSPAAHAAQSTVATDGQPNRAFQPRSLKASSTLTGLLPLRAAADIAPEVAAKVPRTLPGALSGPLPGTLPQTLSRQPFRALSRDANAGEAGPKTVRQPRSAQLQRTVNSSTVSKSPGVPSAAAAKDRQGTASARSTERPVLYADRPEVAAAASTLALQLAESGEFARARTLLQMLPPPEQAAVLAKIEAWEPPQPLHAASANDGPASNSRTGQQNVGPERAQALLSRLSARASMLQALESRLTPSAVAPATSEAAETTAEAVPEEVAAAVAPGAGDGSPGPTFEALALALPEASLELPPVQPPDVAEPSESGEAGNEGAEPTAIAIQQRPTLLEPAEVNQQAVRDTWAAAVNIPEPPPLPDTLAYAPRPQNLSPSGMIFPLAVPAPMTSPFGWRIHPISGARRLHAGTDFGAPEGTPVVAALAGKVTRSAWTGGYGLAIEIEHQDGTLDTFYAHLSQALVQTGDWVEQGTVIGHVGTTGYSTGPHLHFEVRRSTAEGRVEVDPMVELGPSPTYANQTASAPEEVSEPAAVEPAPSAQPTPEYAVAPVSEVKSVAPQRSVVAVEAADGLVPSSSPVAQPVSQPAAQPAAATQMPVAPQPAPRPVAPDRISTLKLEDFNRWSNLCRSQMSSGQYIEALAACNRTIALQPANLELWMTRGQLLEKLGRHAEAVTVYSHVLQRQPQHSEAQQLRARALLASDKAAEGTRKDGP